MAELLRDGATMLDQTCPQCENIIFRLKNNSLYCPTCNSQLVWEHELNKNNSLPKAQYEPLNAKFDNEINSVRKKIAEITSLLENTTQSSYIGEWTKILLDLLKIYKEMQSLG